nr:T9SS type A sorting domain-containing protein [Bacteroidota bacterium]
MTIFPNPATDIINIFADGLSEIFIYNQTGQLMLNRQVDGDNTKLEVHNLEAGVYFIKIVTVSGIINEKLIMK